MRIVFSLAVFLCASHSITAIAAEKSCKCRSSKSGSYLELTTTHDDGRMIVTTLETFTMNGAQNPVLCKAQMKKQPECGGTPDPAAPAAQAPAAPKGVKLTGAHVTSAFLEVGLAPGDLVTLINKAPVKSTKDFAAITDAQEKGGRVDVQVIRGENTVDLWYEFPKPQ